LPRRPETSTLHRTLRQHLETFLARAEDRGGVPRIVEREMRRFLECGVAAHGFVRVHSGDCGHGRLVPFSCLPPASDRPSIAGRRARAVARSEVQSRLRLADVGRPPSRRAPSSAPLPRGALGASGGRRLHCGWREGGRDVTKEPKLENPAPENAKPPLQTWRILFVESADKIDLLKDAAKHAGYVVVGATTIEEAWAFLESKDHADVIVCAAHLEDESVFEMLRRVRASDVHRNTMFLVLSLEPGEIAARQDRWTKVAGEALGADAYVVMPVFDAHELIAQIRALQPPVPVLQSSKDDERPR
jgi:CheY-like chemotaxis protein